LTLPSAVTIPPFITSLQRKRQWKSTLEVYSRKHKFRFFTSSSLFLTLQKLDLTQTGDYT
jgi:hypothetical protein